MILSLFWFDSSQGYLWLLTYSSTPFEVRDRSCGILVLLTLSFFGFRQAAIRIEPKSTQHIEPQWSGSVSNRIHYVPYG